MTKMTTQPQVLSIRTKLANLARSRDVDFPQVFTLFLLERAALRLIQDDVLSRQLVFKGGFVNVRIYNSMRHTTDLDALLCGLSKEVAMDRIKAAMKVNLGDNCWFELEEVIDLQTQGEYGGTRFTHRSGLGERPAELKSAQVVNIDIGVGDPVTPAPIRAQTELSLGEGSLSWLVYPAETIVAEKLHALVSLGSRNSRSKDVFDIKLLLPQTQQKALQSALSATFEFRGDPLPQSIANLIDAFDKSQLRRGWSAAVRSIRHAPSFEETLAEVVLSLRKLDI